MASDGRALDASVRGALFRTRLASGANISVAGYRARAQYTVAPGGRFLMNVAAADGVLSPITVVHNWTAGLKI
jgi:hypothetical protein